MIYIFVSDTEVYCNFILRQIVAILWFSKQSKGFSNGVILFSSE